MTTSNNTLNSKIKAATSRMMASTLCIITSLASHVDADTIKLSNGDALTGTLQSFDQDLAVLQSSHGGLTPPSQVGFGQQNQLFPEHSYTARQIQLTRRL